MDSTASDLTEFLKHPTQRVLLLQGAWGIGKTYFWNEFIEENSALVTEKSYVYVSLFGISSTKHFKDVIVAQLSQTFNTVKKIAAFTKGADIPLLKQATAFADNIASNVQELFIHDCLICIDDLERKSSSLQMAEVMGLISLLRDSKKHRCRLVLICNPRELQSQDAKEFETYREKIIDRQLTYSPSLNRNLRIVFAEADADAFSQIFEDLTLNNIRVMQQAQWAIEYFEPTLAKHREQARTEFRLQTVKLSCLYYAFPAEVPVEKLIGHAWLREAMGKDKEKPRHYHLLKRIGFRSSPCDAEILDYLQHGKADVTAVDRKLCDLDKTYAQTEELAEFRSVWERLVENFAVDTQALRGHAHSVLQKVANKMPLAEVAEMVKALNEAVPNEDWNQYMRSRIGAAIPNAAEDLLQTLGQFSKPEWQDITAQIDSRRSQLTERWTISDLVQRLAATNSWDPKDFTKLNMFTAQQIEGWMRDCSDEAVLQWIRNLLGRIQPEVKPEHAALRETLTTGLRNIAAESALNAFRVSRILDVSLSAEEVATAATNEPPSAAKGPS